MKRFLMTLFVMVMIPYVSTLAWTGRLEEGGGFGESGAWRLSGAGTARSAGSLGGLGGQQDGRKTVLVERNGRQIPVSVEEFLVNVLAKQIPADYGTETIKAQAVLARTYIYREMDGADSIPEEALDMDALSRAQMEKLWGSKEFAGNYEKLMTAIQATAGQAVTYEGAFIEPFFCRAAAGKTRSRSEEYPYLKQTESPGDLEAEDFLSMSLWTAAQIADRVNGIPGAVTVQAAALPEEIQVVERDGAGYVLKIQVGQKTYSGEEIQYALGLPSTCYSFESFDGKIRVTVKGIGHGYGFSQAGANALEREGYDYRELLNFYFQNIEIADFSE